MRGEVADAASAQRAELDRKVVQLSHASESVEVVVGRQFEGVASSVLKELHAHSSAQHAMVERLATLENGVEHIKRSEATMLSQLHSTQSEAITAVHEAMTALDELRGQSRAQRSELHDFGSQLASINAIRAAQVR